MKRMIIKSILYFGALAWCWSVAAVAFQPTTSITFELNSSTINPYDHQLLNDVAKILERNPGARIMLIGNTDATVDPNSKAYNLYLAQKRVSAVENYLLSEKAIPRNQIKTAAFADVPTLCDSPMKSILGRRVDILYCMSDSSCQQNFDAYSSWLQNHCSEPSSVFSYEPENYAPRFALTVSYLIPRAWTESSKSASGLTFSDGTALGDFNQDQLSNPSMVDIEFSVHAGKSPTSYWLNPLYLGIDVWSQLSSVTSQGEFIYDRLLPANHYRYQYAIAAKGIGAVAKFYFLDRARFKPYALIGAGVAQLTTSNFQLTPIGDSDPTTLNYDNAKKNNFYYKAALGFDYSVNNHFRMGLNYFYNDLGKYQIGPGDLNGHTAESISKTLSVDGVAVTTAIDF